MSKPYRIYTQCYGNLKRYKTRFNSFKYDNLQDAINDFDTLCKIYVSQQFCLLDFTNSIPGKIIRVS